MFMPPNLIPLIKPMDQKASRLIKLYHTNKLQKYVVAEGENMAECLRWNIISIENDVDEADLALARLQQQLIEQNSEPWVQEITDLLQVIEPVRK